MRISASRSTVAWPARASCVRRVGQEGLLARALQLAEVAHRLHAPRQFGAGRPRRPAPGGVAAPAAARPPRAPRPRAPRRCAPTLARQLQAQRIDVALRDVAAPGPGEQLGQADAEHARDVHLAAGDDPLEQEERGSAARRAAPLAAWARQPSASSACSAGLWASASCTAAVLGQWLGQQLARAARVSCSRSCAVGRAAAAPSASTPLRPVARRWPMARSRLTLAQPASATAQQRQGQRPASQAAAHGLAPPVGGAVAPACRQPVRRASGRRGPAARRPARCCVASRSDFGVGERSAGRRRPRRSAARKVGRLAAGSAAQAMADSDGRRPAIEDAWTPFPAQPMGGGAAARWPRGVVRRPAQGDARRLGPGRLEGLHAAGSAERQRRGGRNRASGSALGAAAGGRCRQRLGAPVRALRRAVAAQQHRAVAHIAQRAGCGRRRPDRPRPCRLGAMAGRHARACRSRGRCIVRFAQPRSGSSASSSHSRTSEERRSEELTRSA